MKPAATIAFCCILGLTASGQERRSLAAKTPEIMPVQVVIEKKIQEAWQDFKSKKQRDYANLLADDFSGVEIDGKGPHDKRASVDEASAGTLNSYSLKDIKVTPLCANVALASYAADTDGTMPDGKQVHATVIVTEVWVKRAGEWKSLRYHESELK
jgi:ketosteroid isomerase-like protein